MTLKFDPDKFDPDKIDASDFKINDITTDGRAVQIIGVPRPLGKLVWDPTVDISDIKPIDVTAEWAGTGVQIIGGVRPTEKPTDEKKG